MSCRVFVLKLLLFFFPSLLIFANQDYIESFECTSYGAAITTLRTDYYKDKDKRIWKFKCGQINKNHTQKCQYFGPALGAESFEAQCPLKNGYITGMAKWAESSSNFTIYRFKCCAVEERELVLQTCFTSLLVDKAEDAGLVLSNEEGVITQLQAVFDADHNDRTWYVTVCNFADVLTLTKGRYYKFPSAQPTKYGNPGKNFQFKHRCTRGKAVNQIDSIYGYANEDRIMFVSCEYVNGKKLSCTSLFTRNPELEESTSNYSYPKNWTSEGCRGHEVMTSIKSSVHNKIRRFSFGCCQLADMSVDESNCTWEQASDQNDSDWSLKAPTGKFVRGISSTFSQVDKITTTQATVEVEKTTESSNETTTTASDGIPFCEMSWSNYVPQSVYSKQYLKMDVGFIDECAVKCQAHAFCKSFRFTGNGQCYFSYATANCTDADLQRFPYESIDSTDEFWVMCYRC